jgi:cell division protease FtsH
MTLGHTLVPPKTDRIHLTKKQLVGQIATMMGGRAAEEMVFSEMTTGAASDIDKATRIAREMVTEYGMSDLGPINFGPDMDVTEWGKAYWEKPQISPEMQSKIDSQMKKFVDDGYAEAVKILKKYRKKLDEVSTRLLEVENMDGDEFEHMMSA